MNKEFCTYEQAVVLKELGYYGLEFGQWWEDKDDGEKFLFTGDDMSEEHDQHDIRYICEAPLKQQVFRWFREKYNILGTIYSNASGYLFEWHDAIGGTQRGCSEYEGPNDSGCWDSYEETEDACIDKLIELVKTQTNE